jgi:hypothetical protein
MDSFSTNLLRAKIFFTFSETSYKATVQSHTTDIKFVPHNDLFKTSHYMKMNACKKLVAREHSNNVQDIIDKLTFS